MAAEPFMRLVGEMLDFEENHATPREILEAEVTPEADISSTIPSPAIAGSIETGDSAPTTSSPDPRVRASSPRRTRDRG